MPLPLCACVCVAQHMQDMLTLTTRMNALARITLGNVNIAATTALQVRHATLPPAHAAADG